MPLQYKDNIAAFAVGRRTNMEEWNTITRYDTPDNAAWLLHYPLNARRWRGTIHYRLDDPGAWKAVKEFEGGRK